MIYCSSVIDNGDFTNYNINSKSVKNNLIGGKINVHNRY